MTNQLPLSHQHQHDSTTTQPQTPSDDEWVLVDGFDLPPGEPAPPDLSVEDVLEAHRLPLWRQFLVYRDAAQRAGDTLRLPWSRGPVFNAFLDLEQDFGCHRPRLTRRLRSTAASLWIGVLTHRKPAQVLT